MSWVHVAVVSIAWRWLPSFDIGPLERQTRPPVSVRNERAPKRVTMAEPEAPRPARLAQAADEVVVRALNGGRAALVRCWKRALDADPLLDATKVTVRVEVDAAGGVRAVTHDAANAKLGNCLALVSRGLAFEATGSPAVAQFPLFFKPD